ncbi:hypothetical protein BJY52DRAFT_1255618 [Lactarius psammicola]|nr:hypothetical protein BJY52DRAFT_1255618 [Lactarius psammicola]
MHKLNVPVTSLTLEIGKPFDASFQLHGGERLTLLDIVRSRLPNAKFAFLSCCHSAEITEKSILPRRCSIVDSEVSSGPCGQRQIRMVGTCLRTSTNRCPRAESRVCHTMSDLRERYGTRHGS